MNFYNISYLNLFNKECKRKDVSNLADLAVQYGIENATTEKWKEIVQEKNEIKRKKLIDDLVSKLEKNKEINGFFGKDDVVKIDSVNGFKIDDKELYYLFFETLKEGFDQTKKLGYDIVYHAVRNTLVKYFGKPVANSKALRLELTNPNSGSDDFMYLSISQQRGKGTGVCVEQASVAHNLWLLCGVKSYYISTKDMQTDLAPNNGGHSFCVVEYNGSFKLFDSSLELFMKLDFDPIELMRKGLPFEVEIDGKKTTYTNAGRFLTL